MRKLAWIAVVAAAGCSGATANEGASGAADAGAGNVSFGGQQDIGEFQQILDQGGIPGPDTLDANGFFNEHAAPIAPGCSATLCLTPGLSVGKDWLTGQHQATLQLSVTTNVDPTQFQRRPLDVVAVIDRSGSMAEDGRLDKVKLGLATMIAGLQDGDRLALVSFSDSATVDAPLATLDRDALTAAVDALAPGGGTDIFDGLHAGFAMLGSASSPEREQRVILLSDGQANEGDANPDDIIAMADGFVEGGIGITTIGVGDDFDEPLMRGLAEHGAGNFYFLEDPQDATEVFTNELDYFMTPIALDVQISATASPGYTFGDVVGSTLWQSEPASGDMEIPAVFVARRTDGGSDGSDGSDGSGNTGAARRGGGSMLFVHLQPTGHNGSDGKVADITLTYRTPGSGATQTTTVSLAYPNDPTETPDPPYLSVPEMAPRYAMYNMFLGLRAATESTDLQCAASMLVATRGSASSWLETHTDTDLGSDVAIVNEYLANLAAVGAQISDGNAGPMAASCLDTGGGIYTPPPVGGYEEPMGCSTGGATGAGGALAALFAGAAITRRRRRR
jgi:Ca-activated chloride channel family protein|nr:VWA domain-containing protein [Kofleriaceae bacterium]